MADTTDRRFARLGFTISDHLKVIKKKIENRREPRRACEMNAWIRAEGCFATQQCRILDHSPTGVRLAIADAYRIPRSFILLWSRNGTGRHARIKWRRSTEIGAEFLTADDLRPIYLAGRIADNVAKLQELLRR